MKNPDDLMEICSDCQGSGFATLGSGYDAVCGKCGGQGGYLAACAVHCSVCEGQDHHWIPDYEEETGEARMACKHCEAIRDLKDSDFEEVEA